MKSILLVSLLAISFNSLAGGEKGNGGDVVICGNSVQLLDKVEALKKKFKLSLPAGSIEEKVKYVGDNFLKVDGYRGELFKKYSADLLNDIRRHEKGEEDLKHITFADEALSDIDDSYEYSIPYDCTKQQLVIRRDAKDIFTHDIYQTEYIIDTRLWDKLDDENKAMTVSHEALYKIAVQEYLHNDSRVARHLNGIFSSKTELSFSEYLKLTSQKGTKVSFSLKGDIVSDLGLRNEFIIAQPESKTAGGALTYEMVENSYYVTQDSMSSSRLFQFDLEGKLMKASIGQQQPGGALVFLNATISIKAGYISKKYDSDGKLSSFDISSTKITTLIINDQTVKLPKKNGLRFKIKNNKVIGFETI